MVFVVILLSINGFHKQHCDSSIFWLVIKRQRPRFVQKTRESSGRQWSRSKCYTVCFLLTPRGTPRFGWLLQSLVRREHRNHFLHSSLKLTHLGSCICSKKFDISFFNSDSFQFCELVGLGMDIDEIHKN